MARNYVSKAEKDLVNQAVDRFKLAADAYNRQRIQAREDLRFVAGEQWDMSYGSEELRLTVNLLQPFLRQITSEAREANPSIHVIPNGNGADQDLADVYEGLIRHIQQINDATSIYQNALWYAAAGGEGYFFLDSEYCNDESFDQDLVIKNCANPEKVLLDPHHELMDGTDSSYGFIVEDMAQDEYKRNFPNSALANKLNSVAWQHLNLPGDWLNKDSIRVVKYWVKEYTTKTIYLVMDPLTGDNYTTDEKPGEDAVVFKKRLVQEAKVCCYLLNAIEILDEMDWPGSIIPIFKVTGEKFYVGNQCVQHGAVRMAKDPQRQYNYHTTKVTEMIDLAPKNSFVGATGQFANNPEKWANANRVNYGFLDYTPAALNGQMVPPPSRVSGLDGQSFQGVMTARMASLEDLKLVFGLHDASLGRQGNEISGVSIEKRIQQGRRSTYQYFDNLLVSLKSLGRALVELIPYFYDTERVVRIVKPDTSEQLIAINTIGQNGKVRYDMSVGTYDVTVVTGPAYATKREQSLESMTQIMGLLPQAGQVIGDLVASQVDSPVSKLVAARIKATIPKEVLAATGENDQSEDMAPAELVQQLQQQVARDQQELQLLQLEKQELEVKVKLAEDKASMELTKADMEHEREMAKIQQQDQIAEIEARIRLKQLELTERELDLKEKQLQINAAGAAHKVLGDMDIPKESNVGGSID